MKILVTGGAGFIGSNLCRVLVRQEKTVYCLDNLNNYYPPEIKKRNIADLLQNSNFYFLQIDIENETDISNLFKKHSFDAVIHLAARAGVRASLENPVIYTKTNILGTVNLLESCRKNNIKNFIFASSSSVYGNVNEILFKEDIETSFPISPYAATKKAGEVMCYIYSHSYGINVKALRFFTVYGPSNRPDMAAYKFVNAIFQKLPIEMYGDGSTSRDYTYIDDIVEGIVRAIDCPSNFEIINLGSSSPIKLKDFISTIEEIVGLKAQIIKKSLPPGDVERTFADISKAKRLLDWEPKTNLKQGLEKLIQWYKNSKNI